MKNDEQIKDFIRVLTCDDHNSVYFLGTKTGDFFKEIRVKKENLVERLAGLNADHIYMSLNGYASALAPRNQDNLRQVNGIFVDVDGHDLADKECTEAVERTLCTLRHAIAAGELLEPTMMVHSGRGIHLYYVYTKSIPAKITNAPNFKGIKIHKYFTTCIYESVRTAIAGAALKVDEACSDLARYVRVAGTFNAKSESMCTMIERSGRTYTFAELFGFFN